jgi:hypothetical protein
MATTIENNLRLSQDPIPLLAALPAAVSVGSEIAAQQRHRSKRRLSERPRVDPDCPFELVFNGATVGGAVHGPREPCHVPEVNREIEWNHSVFPSAQRQTKWKLAACRTVSFERQRRVQRGQAQSEWIWVGDARPETHGGATERSVN